MNRALSSALVVLACAAPARAGIDSVWAVGDGQKVAPDTTASPLAARNAAWDGRTVRLFGARNEVLAFQVVVQADGAGIEALSAALPELRRRGGEERIRYAPPAKDPSLTAGRPIRLYSVRSMKVTEETHATWVWEPGSPAAPKKTVGWQPVQLVPENARAGRGGFPLTVAPGAAQALWIEVYTGRGRPAGVYEGTVTVRADGTAREVPVELELLDLDLPDEGSMNVMVFYEPEQPALYQGRNLDPAYHRFAHAHRVELVHAYDEARAKASLGRLNGADFTAASGYEGPGEGRGNRIVPLTFYGPGKDFDVRASAWRRADAWASFLAATLPKAETFLYLPDEPRPKQYPYLRQLAANVHSNPGPGRTLPTFVTKSIVPELEGAIDIWCVPPQEYDIAKADAERAKGRRVWFYNGGRPNGPALVIDAPATEARVVGWAAFKHHADTYFYWHGVHWRHNSQKQGERVQNVWASPVTFDNRGQPNKEDFGTINGDGVLLYPGQDVLHPEEDRGIEGPVATVQLANLRRGAQDHLYLTMASQLGLEGAVRRALETVVPRVFSDAGRTVGFAETGETFEAARRELADAIVAARRAVTHPRLQTFWGGDFQALAPSNRRAVVPGAWRIELTPSSPARDDVFLNVLEIGDRDASAARRVAAIEGHGLTGASISGASVVLFAATPVDDAEATLPAIGTSGLLVSGLERRPPYEIQLTSGFAPGAPRWSTTAETTDDGTLRVAWDVRQEARLRLRRLRSMEGFDR